MDFRIVQKTPDENERDRGKRSRRHVPAHYLQESCHTFLSLSKSTEASIVGTARLMRGQRYFCRYRPAVQLQEDDQEDDPSKESSGRQTKNSRHSGFRCLSPTPRVTSSRELFACAWTERSTAEMVKRDALALPLPLFFPPCCPCCPPPQHRHVGRSRADSCQWHMVYRGVPSRGLYLRHGQRRLRVYAQDHRREDRTVWREFLFQRACTREQRGTKDICAWSWELTRGV